MGSGRDVTTGRRRAGLAALVAAGVAAMFGVAACGGDSDTPSSSTPAAPAASQLEGLSAQEVLTKAKAAVDGAAGVHVVGDILSDGNAIKFDVTFSGADSAKGTLTIGGNPVELVKVGTDTYVKAPAAFYAQFVPQGGDAIGQLIGDKYLKVPPSQPQADQLGNFIDRKTFFEGLLSPEGQITRVDGKDVDGTKTVGLKSDNASSGGTMYISDAGEPYPLLLEAPVSDTDKGSVRMSDWGKTAEIAAPPADQVLDLSQFSTP